MHINFENGLKLVLSCKNDDNTDILYLFQVNISSSIYSRQIMFVLSRKLNRETNMYLFFVNS